MTLRWLTIVTTTLLLTGCATEPQWNGESPARMVRPVQRIVDLALPAPVRGSYQPHDLDGLRQTLAVASASGSVRVEILAPTSALQDSTSQAVRGLGVPAPRVSGRVVPDLPGNASIIIITSTGVAAPGCAAPALSPARISFSELPDLPLGCADATNFARMLADPEDLVRKPGPVAANTRPLADAIDRQRSRVTADPDGKGGGGAAGEAGGTGTGTSKTGGM